jgi:hypothetical protein
MLTIVAGGKVPLTLLSDPAAKCMDGTQAGYYYEPSKGGDFAQKGWVIHLQGGGECTDEASCTDQLGTARASSDYFDPYLWDLTFLASNNQQKNPDMFQWNHVFVPYCSQDLYSGQVTTPSEETFGFYFSGHFIISAIVQKMQNSSLVGGGLGGATTVVLSGDSAGGIGTWINMDWLQSQIPQANVVGAPIAGYYFFSFPYTGPGHTEGLLSDMSAGAWAANVATWDSFLPLVCAEALGQDAPYCMLSNYSAPYTAAPMFVIEAQTDCVQLVYHDSVPSDARADTDEDLRAYMVAFQTNQTQGLYANLKPGDGWFNPACFIHTEFTYTNPTIGGASFVDAFDDWLFGNSSSGPPRLMDNCGDDVFCNENCSMNWYC